MEMEAEELPDNQPKSNLDSAKENITAICSQMSSITSSVEVSKTVQEGGGTSELQVLRSTESVCNNLPQEAQEADSLKFVGKVEPKKKKIGLKMMDAENIQPVPLRVQMGSIRRHSKLSSSSVAKKASVPPSMIFKTKDLKTEDAKFICADGSYRDVSDVWAGNNEMELVDNCDDYYNEMPSSPSFEESGIQNSNHLSNSNAEFHFLFGNVILQLKHPASFPFCGQLHIEVIKGAVEILGYILTPSRGCHSIFSPRGSSLLPIETVVSENKDTCNMSCMDVDATQLTALLEAGGENDAWLLLKKIDSILPAFLDRYVPFKLFPPPNLIEKERTYSKASKKLHCLFDIPAENACFEKGEKWDILHKHVQKSDCTVLCGGKGVGKSTLLRYLVNQLLHHGDNAVVLLDFDPGHAELTVPGCLSAAVISKPLLGPSFTHLQKTERCIYLGEVNVSNCVTRYMDACSNIINFWRSDSTFAGLPCVVNTMGFSKGLGVTFMVQLLSLLKPNFVIQIQSVTDSENFPDHLSVDYVKRNCSISPFSSDLDTQLFSLGVRPVVPTSVNYDLLVMNSMTGNHGEKALGPHHLREVVILSYLSQATSSPCQSILDVVPFSCPLDSLYLNVSHENIDPSLTLSAINGSLVALCHTNHIEEDVVQASTPGVVVITRPIIADCYGFGVVRGVDMDTKHLYISSPLKYNQLASVNCLMLGDVNLPSAMLLNPPKDSGTVPYVAVSALPTFNRSMVFSYMRV